MAEERITETEGPDGRTHTHTTVVTDGGGRGGTGWIALLALVILAAIGIWFFSGMSGSEVAKDNAIAEAAGDVGNAASQVGDAAQDAADNMNR